MRFGVRVSDAARDLRVSDLLRQEREQRRLLVSVLLLQRGPIDGAGLQPRRRAGLQPAHRETRAIQAIRETDRRRLAVAPGGNALVADMDDALQERTGGEDYSLRPKLLSVLGDDTH